MGKLTYHLRSLHLDALNTSLGKTEKFIFKDRRKPLLYRFAKGDPTGQKPDGQGLLGLLT